MCLLVYLRDKSTNLNNSTNCRTRYFGSQKKRSTLLCFLKKFNILYAPENMKKTASKVAHNGPKFFFQYCQLAQNQPKPHILFHKNDPLHDFYIMALILTYCFTVAFIYKMHENKVIQMSTSFSKQRNRQKCLLIFQEIEVIPWLEKSWIAKSETT